MCACEGSSHSLNQTRICSAVIVFVRVLLVSLCALLVQGPRSASCIPVSEFFPFGTDSDFMTERSDDGGSGRINLTVMFPFFGNRHNKIYVNNNGVISFFNELRDYRPGDFPLQDEIPIIAPYWADVDTTNSNGTVWYRESRDKDLLFKATNEIRAFPAYRNFKTYWVFVATWDEVGFFGASGEGVNKKNTFQSVLVLDTTRRLSFVILNYAKIEWTTGSNSLGDTSTGLGGNPAQAGFNAGDKIHFFEIEGAGTDSVINLTTTTNMGVPGKWIFRIDSTEIQDLCSQSDSGLVSFQPPSTSMLGGDPIGVSGLCFDTKGKVPSVQGRLETGVAASEDLCCLIENNSAKCYLPPVFLTGFVNISLNIDGRGWNFTGALEINNIIDVYADVIRDNPSQWVMGNRVSVSWEYTFLDGVTSFLIEILSFKMENGISSLQILSNATYENQDSRNYELDLPKDFLGARVAVVRVTAYPNNCSSLTGPSIYSDVFPVIYTDVSFSHSLCSSWLAEQSKLTPLDVPGNCPCTLRQAEGDTAQYTQDPFCTRNPRFISNCNYRSKSASQCIMPNQMSIEKGAFVCCYDKITGELLVALEGHGGGTMERYHFRQSGPNIVPCFTYMQEEISPYLHCCEFSQNQTLCGQYLKIRQPVGCQGYQPPAAAQAAGDPHIVTLDSCQYTFNGVGEFTLVKVKDSQSTVQVRAVPVQNNQNEPQGATVFTAIAFKASNSSSTLEIRLRMPGEQELVTVYKDSELFPLISTTSQLSEMTVFANNSQNATVELTVVMVDVGLSVLVQATDEMLNIMVMAGSQLKGQLEGLLGNYNGDSTDDFTASDGTVLEPNATMREVHKFGMSWLVSGKDSLFTVDPVSEFDSSSSEVTNKPTYTPVFIDEVQDHELPSDTQRVCDGNRLCQFDYRVTENEAIALATLKFNKRFEERRQDVSEVVRCPYLGADAITNGNRNLTGLQAGNVVIVECNDGYSMNGSDKLTCNENGEWNSMPPTCIRVENTTTSVTTDETTVTTDETTVTTGGRYPTTAQPHSSNNTGSTPPDHASVTDHDFECALSSMNVFIPVYLAPNSVLTLKDPTCQLQNNGTHYVISFPYTSCGTSLTSYDGISYVQNEISVHLTINDTSLVEFLPSYSVPLQCTVQHNSSVHTAFKTVSKEPIIQKNDDRTASFQIKEFKTALYQEEITEYPIKVPINREIFFEVSTQSNTENNTGIRVHQCEATPSSNPNDTNHFLLITNGCSSSPAVKVLPRYSIRQFRFSSQAFNFAAPVNQNNTVYVHCYVSICQANACNGACPRTTRKRRSTKNLDAVLLTSGTHLIITDA